MYFLFSFSQANNIDPLPAKGSKTILLTLLLFNKALSLKIIGFCVRNIGNENNIGALYVVPEARNYGIGKHLLDLAKEGCDYITVWAYELNTKARSFYHREGCIEISREFDTSVNLMDVEHRWKR